MNQSERERVARLKIDGTNYAVSAGTDDVLTSEAIDMAGWTAAKIYIGFGAITAGATTTVKLQQSSDNGSVDTYADLEDSGQAVAADDDNQVVVFDVVRPREQYLKVITTRADENAVVDFLLVVFYGGRKEPTSDDSATVVARKVLVSPAEGTA